MTLREKFENDDTTVRSVAGLSDGCLDEQVVELRTSLPDTKHRMTISLLECGDYLVDDLTSGDTLLVEAGDLDEPQHADVRELLAEARKVADVCVFFDNGGGITVQAEYSGGGHAYCHCYDEGAQAARDAKGLLAADLDLSDWEGDEPFFRVDGVRLEDWQDSEYYNGEKLAALLDGRKVVDLEMVSGHSQRDFLKAFAVRFMEEVNA